MPRRHGGTGLHSLSTCGNGATARRRGLFPRCASCGNAGSVQAVALRLKINQTVLAEALHEMNYDRTDDLDFSQMLNDIVKSIDLPAIQGLNEKQRKILIRRIKSQAKASLLSSRLASRLTAMCKRLGDPITKQELQLLIDVNKARNGLLHGRRSVFLNTLDLDRAIVAASTLIVSKVEKFEESKL